MYSYYNYELIAKQIQAERLRPANCLVPPEAKGEIAQGTATRHHRASRRAQMEAQNARRRLLVGDFFKCD